MGHFVFLRCVKESNNCPKVKIINTGYLNNLNCSFPKHLKENGATYYVKSLNVYLNASSKYYNIKNKNLIKRIHNWGNKQIFVENTCVICMDNDKMCSILFNCGHLCVCSWCFAKLARENEPCADCNIRHFKCPICRTEHNSIGTICK